MKPSSVRHLMLGLVLVSCTSIGMCLPGAADILPRPDRPKPEPKPVPRPDPKGESLAAVLGGVGLATAITLGGVRLARRRRVRSAPDCDVKTRRS